MRSSLLFLLTLFPLCTAAAQPSSGEAILGKAGDAYITESEFIRRFELLPGLYRHQSAQLDEEKLVVFYSIVAEKLLAQEAIDRNLDADSLFLASMADMEKLLSRDELYREEVAGKVRVSEAEVKEGIRRARRELFVTFLYSDSAGVAAFVRGRISTSEDFSRLQMDTSMGMVRDTATIIWGDADQAIEDAAYRLRVGETSPVVMAQNGYYILHLTRERPSGFYTSMKPDVLRDRVAQRLEQRKEKLRLNQYLAGILKGKSGFARPVPFRRLADALVQTYRLHTDQSSITMSDTLLHEVTARLGNAVGDTLVVAGRTVWSVGRVLERLATNGFSLNPAELEELPGRLNRQLEIWVWQELLSQEALRRGMEGRPQVKKDLAEWRESFLAQFMKRYIDRSVKVTDEEVMSYLNRQGDTLHVPLVQIRELRAGSPVEMQEALAELEKNVPFEEVIRRWSNDPAAKQRGGLSEFFPVTDRSPVGEIANQLKIGQFYGPLAVEGGILYFELVARKIQGPNRDTTLAVRTKTAREELRRLKAKRLTNLLIAQSGRKRGFVVYQDRLNAIKVSAVPMMTFRVLGFGGRIWAAPMLEKQVEWLTIEPPQSRVVP
jgi:parvulin-like peptidyl-prolyl isomerase